jgi:hypothetical protein
MFWVKFKVIPTTIKIETPKRHILVLKAIIWFLHHENPLLRSGDVSSEKVQNLSYDHHIHSDQLTKELLTVPEILKTGNVQAACENIRNMLLLYSPNIFCPHGLVRQACASILEPVANDIDRPIQFCAGLANELELVALIENVDNLHQLRIQVNNFIIFILIVYSISF